MRIKKATLKRIIREEFLRLVERSYGDDPEVVRADIEMDISKDRRAEEMGMPGYDQGYDDWVAGVKEPTAPTSNEYMRGWDDAELDKRDYQ
jgi:hypothetical protein